MPIITRSSEQVRQAQLMQVCSAKLVQRNFCAKRHCTHYIVVGGRKLLVRMADVTHFGPQTATYTCSLSCCIGVRIVVDAIIAMHIFRAALRGSD